MTMTGFRSVMIKLQKESFYIPMYVFLTVYKNLEYVGAARDVMFLELFIKECRTNGTDIFKEFYQILN